MSTQYLVQYLYYTGKQYEDIDSIMDDINDNPSSAEKYRRLAQTHYLCTTYLSAAVDIPRYSTMLRKVNDTLATFGMIEKTEERIHDAIGEILSALVDYAVDMVNFFESFTDQDWNDTIYPSISLTFYIFTKSDPSDRGRIDITEISTELERLWELLEKEETYPELFKFICTPTLGSSGTAYFKDILSPLIVNVLPYDYVEKNFETLLRTRFPPIDGQDPDDIWDQMTYIDDEELQKLELLAQSSLRTKSFTGHQDELLKRAFHKKTQPQGNDPANQFGMSSGTSSRPSGHRKGPPKRGDPHADQQRKKQRPSSPHPTIPDDTSYTPSGMLSARARDMITEYQSMDPPDMAHDHMTRFNTTAESASTVSRSDLRYGPHADWTFTTKDRFGTYRYLVTFTRKSKKPIFSQIS